MSLQMPLCLFPHSRSSMAVCRGCHLTQFVEVPDDPLAFRADDKVQGYFGRLSSTTRLYLDIAACSAASALALHTKRLNAAGGKALAYNAGDQVMVYVPRGDSKSGWKAKYTIQARGPCTVQQRLGASTYKGIP